MGKAPPPTESNLPEIWTDHSLAGPDRDILGWLAGGVLYTAEGPRPFQLSDPRPPQMTATERNTATLLKPLTMDRQEDGSFDPSTYCEYWFYKEAVCPVTDSICLCTACRVSLSRRDFHNFSKRNGCDMFDNYPEELAILNPLETAPVSIVLPINRMFQRHH